MESMAIQALVQAGVAGVVLGWFMLRSESRMERLERSINQLTRAQMLMLLSRPDVDEGIKRQARDLLTECPPPHPSVQQFTEAHHGV